MKMDGISTKLTAGGLSGAVTGVLIYVVSLFGLYVPGEIGAYIVVIVSFAIGWCVKEKRLPSPAATIPLADQPAPTATRPAIDLPTIPQP